MHLGTDKITHSKEGMLVWTPSERLTEEIRKYEDEAIISHTIVVRFFIIFLQWILTVKLQKKSILTTLNRLSECCSGTNMTSNNH